MKLSEIGQKLLKEEKKELRLLVVEGKFPLPPAELVYIISMYALENKEGIRDNCIGALKKMPVGATAGFLKERELEGSVLYLLSYVFQDNLEILGRIFQHPAVPAVVLEKFSENHNETLLRFILANEEKWTKNEKVLNNLVNNPALPKEFYDKISFYLPKKIEEPAQKKWAPPPAKEKQEVDILIADVGENDEDKKRSIAGKILKLTVAEKIKLALMGNKEVRSILVRDSNKLVSSGVLKNPRITEGEVIKISQDRNASEDIIRTIANDRNWTQNYVVKLNLTLHPKTPAMIAVKFLPALGNKDLATVTKSKNVSSVIATQARKIMMTRTR